MCSICHTVKKHRNHYESYDPNLAITQLKIGEVCDELRNLLLEKNASYGNSFMSPINVFSKTDAMEQINVRIDDKLKRIASGKEFANEDTELDLIGYLILKRVAKRLDKEFNT